MSISDLVERETEVIVIRRSQSQRVVSTAFAAVRSATVSEVDSKVPRFSFIIYDRLTDMNDIPRITRLSNIIAAVNKKFLVWILFILSIVIDLKLIAYAPYSLQAPLVADIFQFFPQTLDMHVNCAGVAEVVKAPYLVQQLISGVNLIGR